MKNWTTFAVQVLPGQLACVGFWLWRRNNRRGLRRLVKKKAEHQASKTRL